MNPAAMPSASAEDIAVIGLALRLPGADTLDELSGHLSAGRSLISEVPSERWSKERYFGDPRRGAEKTSSVWGGFIDHADCFDAAFFRISPREAESMDPQQRFALELAWKAIEDAGYRASDIAGTPTGVFMGVCHADYAELMERDRAKTDAYFPTGTAYSIIANRVSYHFDFQGPSITNDTACSSSLVSVYEAVSALQRGECGLALAGGVNLCWSPKHFIAFSQAGMLSRTGRSRAFDQNADGYVRGEGGAVLLLKPLARAVEDGDPVHAVIKGIGTNHGGRTNSLTVTNPAAQSQLIEGLYTRAGIRPETISYIEAHGPGTPVGDPIEIIALKRAFQNLHAAQGTEARPATCGVGSVKTNIGHLEGAAGVAGMAKVIASLAGRTLPATVGFEAQNKLIKLDGSPFFIVRDTQPWDAPDGQDGPLRAGVSSFGFGGTNAHVVLEEYVRVQDDDEHADDEVGPELVPLSARTSEQLREVARELLDHLRTPHSGDGAARRLADIAYTLQIGREPMAARVAFVAANLPELGASLASFVDGTLAEATVHGDAYDTPGLLREATRWVEGETDTVDVAALHGGGYGERRRVRLPTYPFARERHWFRIPEAPVEGGATSFVQRNTSDAGEQRYSATLTGDEPFLAAHQVRGARVLPAAAHLEMARAAAHEAAGPGASTGLRLRDVTFLRPVVADASPLDVQVSLAPGEGRAFAYQLSTGGASVIHSRGTAEVGGLDTPERVDLTARRAACPTRRAPGDVYTAFHDQGLEYGAAMRGLAEIYVGTDELVARIARPGPGMGPALPPSVLDAALQGSVLLLNEAGGGAPPQGPALPFALDALEVHGPCPDDTWAWVRRRAGGGSLDTFDIDLCDAQGAVAVRLRGLVQRRAPADAAQRADTSGGGVGRVVTATCQWVDAPLGSASGPSEGAPAAHAPAVQGPTAQGPSAQGPSAVGLVAQSPTAHAPSAQGLSVQGSVGQGPAAQGLSAQGSTAYAPTVHGSAALQGPTEQSLAAQGPGAHAPAAQAPTAHAPAAHAPAVHGFIAGGGPALGLAGGSLTRLPDITRDRLADGVDAALGVVFARVQELMRSRPQDAQRVLVLVDDRVPRHFHAPLAALLQTAATENPLVSGSVVRIAGLDTAAPERVAAVLAAEAAAPAGPGEVRYGHDGTRQEWRPVDVGLGAGPQVPPLKDGGVYWLTGGLGGLGRHFARYFARSGRVTVVLSGRSARGAASDAALRELRAAGVDAHYRAVDVGRREDVEQAVRAITREHGSLDGIVHAAGVLRDGYLLTKDAAELPAVLEPKVRGTLHLDAATRDLGLDFFAVFSSVAGVYGNSGQADYAAANAFLDAFAHHRQALVDIGERTGRTVAVSWPLWADGGMTVDAVTRESMRKQRGWEPLPTEDGLRVFGRALGDAPGHVVVAYGADPTLSLARRDEQRPATPTTTVAPAAGDLTEPTEELLKRILGEVLHHEPDAIDTTVNLVEYGIDSLAILETTARLEEHFGPLPKTVFFEYVTIEDVAGYFLASHRATLETILGGEAPAAAEPAAEPKAVPAAEPQAEIAAAAPLTVTDRPTAPSRDDYHDIAVIGISGTYPGADTMDELWSLLEEGRHTFEEVPRDRWDHDAIYSRDRAVLGKSSIRTGTFLRGIDAFDPRYFRVSKRDAEQMSPEVRLFLQTGVEALEDAGYSRETIQRQYGGDVGVLVGAMSNHYGLYGFQNSLTRGSAASGSYTGTLPNMLSYFYGLTGPSIFLDTMCSGSSACVHQAVQMLRARECKMVVAGGVNLLLHPYNLISSSQEHFTTATSDVIRSFGLGADGTILGEGVGAVVLKPLVEAERDGDHVYAVIKGTALTNAGVRNGFTVPSPRAQARAVEKAIDDAGVDPRTISYVEGHGSGTSLGDPIEVKALTDAFRKHTGDTQFCALGSVKSNLGHLLHAAGMIGFAKVILQMEKGTLAPSLHSDELNPDIDFSGTPFRVQRALAPWEPVTIKGADGRVVTHPRRAGITSIGAGGMNSHIILEEYPGAPGRHDVRDGRDELFVFSAMTDAALDTSLARFRAYLTGADESELPSIAFTLRVGKNELPRRWAFFASDTRGAVAAIDRYLAGDRDLTAALHSADPRAAAARDLGTTWAGGKSVDWAVRLGDPRRLRRVPLPAYPFDRVSCWVTPEPGAPSVLAPLALRDKLHPFLGRNESDVDGLRYTLDVRLDDLLDYGYQRGRERDIVPAFALDVALAVARLSGLAADPAAGVRVRDLRVLGPIEWTATERLTITLDTTRPEAAQGVVFAEDASGARTRVVEFDLVPDGPPGPPNPARPRESVRFDAVRTLDQPQLLAELAEGGLDYEPMLCGIDRASWLRDGRLVLTVGAPELQRDHTKPGVILAPHVLAAFDQGAHLVAKSAGLPHWERQTWRHTADVRLHTGAPDVAYAVLDLAAQAESGALAGSVTLLGPGGEVAVELTGVRYGDHDTPGQAVPRSEAPRHDTPRDVPRDGGIVSFVVDELRGMASDILKFDADELDVHTGFDSFGFDSISLVTFSKRIHERFGIDVSPAVFFDVRTFDALGRHLATEYEEPVRAAHEAQAPSPAQAPVREVARPAAVPEVRTAPDHENSEGDTPMPIAVIGAAGRFPGAPDLDTYWANLIEGKDSVTEFPRHRYDAAYQRVVDEADFPRHAGVLDDVDAFDAGFFRIYPREAELMDPQHRLALETVWGALEDSAYTRADLPRNTGLFLGVSGTDYATLLTTYGVEPDAFTSTGNAHSMLVNRVSYVLDIRGPSQPVDTACSSSLIAVHRALDAVRSGACEVAVAGGVNLLLSVDTFVSAQRAGMLSPDGRCKTFARDADGYVRGEGVGAVVLKPLAAAERDGDAILAVLRGSAENHGGRANSLTAPNADAQTELVTAALGDLDPDTIGYIETHGTGTALGDPVEVRALQSAFRRLGGGSTATCGLGSVKSNIGHLEAAAGIAGLLKVILAMRHGVLPATRHCAEINPFIQLDEGPFHIVRQNEPWPRPSGSGRRAGVSSFGFGGSNCHVVVEEYVPKASERGDGGMSDSASVIVPISARTDEQLRHVARRLLAHLGDPGRSDTLPSIAWTLQTGREAMERRTGWVVASRTELTDKLRAFVERGEHGSAPGGELGALLTRWTEGGDVEWRTLYGTDTPLRAHLPTYPFARERYWIPGTETPEPTHDTTDDTTDDTSAQSLLPVIGTTLFVPRWAPRPAPPGGGSTAYPYARRLVILCGTTATARDTVERRVPGVRCHTVTTAKQRLDSRFADLSRQVFETVRELTAEPAAGGGATLVQVVVPTDGDDATLLALAGLLRTAALESPRFTGQMIGVDGAATRDTVVATVVADNTRATDGDVIRYDDGVRTVQTWDVPAPNAAAGIPWRAGGTYLITGGASGIGAVVARHIAHGVDRPTLVLVGRRAKDSHIDALLEELRGAGAVARYERADISRWEEVRHLVAQVREEIGELHGIVHSAGVLRDATLAKKMAEEWDDVLAPKVDGLVHLDRATASTPLDFLLTFSSGSALTGNPGQADYATANAFLDAFATLRTARVAAGERSGRTLSIAWPLWKDGGMAVDEATRAYLWHSRGLVPMDSVDGLAALLRAWRLGADRVWVHHGDPDKALETAQFGTPEHATGTPDRTREIQGTTPAARHKPSRAASEQRAGREALHHLLDLFARVTKVARQAVDADEPIGAMGLDSIMVVQLNKELSARYGDVSKTLFYEHPTLRAVAAHLATEHASPAPEDTAPVDTAPVETTVTPNPTQQPSPAPSPGAREPIAIIGMSGRYPQAENLTAFWENLKAGRDCVGEIPADRWSLDGFYEPDRATAVATGRSYSKWGGFLEDFAAFDPLHFQIAPRDAYAMDPQERLFLQASWEVLEDAGYAREELARRHQRRVGVFAGVTKTGHARHGVRRLPSGETAAPVVSFASLSARTSYVLDLRGPSLTLDTMCSASLTAIHEACEHLHQGACELAIAGGVNLYLHPQDYIELCGSTMLSADARCRSFGSGGDGFVPGEGVGCVLLKPLSRALADGDRVLAVIRGTSINHGGRSNGYTVPNPGAQAELIRDAMTRAGVSARDVSYVEAHGTGTELGDPIEVKGLSLAFEQDTQDTPDTQYCALGSVKSGIGHLEAAAGVAGLTKAVLQLRHGQLVPSLHAEDPNPNIAFERTPFFVQRELSAWESDGRPRIASVSSFGAGGSNAHVILEEYATEQPPPTGGVAEGAEHIVVLSARTPEQLHTSAARLTTFLDTEDVRLADLAFTLQVGREAMKERLAVVASSVPELRGALREFVDGGDGTPGVYRATAGHAQGALAEIAADDDLRDLLVQRWARAGKAAKLAALWVEGVAPDWHALHAPATPRRIALPTYPFAKDRYWIGDLDPVADTAHVAQVAVRQTTPAAMAAPPAAPAQQEEPLDAQVARVVRDKLAKALAMRENEVEGGHAFADYGLDSILGVRLVHELNETLALDLPTSVIYDHSTADRLTAHILGAHRPVVARTEPRPAPATTQTPPTTAPATPRPPIAIVGISGRFAGSDSPDELWEHLAAGHDLVGEATRWDLKATDSSTDNGAAKRCTRGGFLDHIDEFDPLFFNISGVEAAIMDPQQRLLLEESWKALEDAGYAGHRMSDVRCGVYVGCWDGDYQELLGEDAPAQAFWGNTASFIPSRISYFLNLKGPAIAVDTSCSSSLVAIDLACKDLAAGETSMALAGGVYVQSTPRLYDLAGRAGMLSPTGRCHTFDHRANGFVPGEAVGALVLKRLDDALADGDHVYGVIRASGVNHDGATNGITAPSSASQESLLREVYDAYGIDVEHIQLVEAHGTGTKLGDPIEFQALTRAFRKATDKSEYCALGSVKTNLGHTQHAAGVAGVVKVLLALKHRQIPASLHFETANEAVALDGSPFYVSTRTHRWETAPGVPRRAVVSSFGASGTNAHLVIDEGPAPERVPAPRPAYLVALSAHSRDQLTQQLTRLATHLRGEPGLDCGDVAHTLIAGREHFAHRFACVVRDREELVRVLAEGFDGPHAFTGEAVAASGTGDSARLGEEALRRCSGGTAHTDAPLAYRTDLELLAELFVQGVALDYAEVIPETARRRVPLPTYPFARERHWPTTAAPAPAPVAPEAPATPEAPTPATREVPVVRHPMVSRSAPHPDGGHHATTTLTGDESYLRDHTVHGRRILPGVAHLEMARAAAAHALGADITTPLRMRNVTWVQALAVEGAPVDVEVRVKPLRDGGGVAFDIASPGTAESAVHSEGRIARSDTPRPAPLDLAALRADCPNEVSPARVAGALRAMGIVHGASLRAIEEAYTGPGRVVARLALPDAAEPADAAEHADGAYVLHPALMDSAIQASMALHLADGADGPQDTAIPFALDRLELFAPCTPAMWAVVRVADSAAAVTALSRLDIDLVDDTGAVCVAMTGYTSRRVPEPVPSLYAPVWEPLAPAAFGAPVPSTADRVLVVGGSAEQRAALTAQCPQTTVWSLAPDASIDEVADALRDAGPLGHLVWIAPDTDVALTDAAALVTAQQDGVLAAFRMVKALLRTRHDARPLGLTLVTRRAVPTHATDEVRPVHAGLHGLFGSLGQEYPNWTVRRLDLDVDTEWPADLATLPAHSHGDTWVRRAGQWLGRRLAPCATEATGTEHTGTEHTGSEHTATGRYREDGVYVVIGGAGGLGAAWTEHVVERYGARVVWIGRRERDAEIDAKLRAIGGRGEVTYLAADATDPAALARAHAEIIDRYGHVNGVVQAALVLRDQSLANMDEDTFRASLAAKVDASAAMAAVFADDDLDFALFFSSIQSFTTAAGQSNYASGCTFADAYAHALSGQWPGPVKVMNWGWWGSIGSVASDFHRERMARWGLLSIEPPEGMAALGTLLGGPQRQLSFVKLTEPAALQPIDPATRLTVYERDTATRIPADALMAHSGLADSQEILRTVADWRAERDALLGRMTRGHLEAMGVVRNGETYDNTTGATTDLTALRERGAILDRYTTWLEHALRTMPATAPPLDALNQEWKERCAEWSADPDKRAELRLVDATLAALPDILTGRTRPTDIMFPRGSLELVEGCYKNNRVADTFNRAMADAAVGVVSERLRRNPGARLRILEIGAGTGGTSVGLFAALRPYQEHIETYTYTDLSKAFLNHAQSEYGPDVPYLDTTRLDAEQPLAAQGIEVGGYDLVVAANVLHATRDTRTTLRNAKSALRDGGWLLLNELCSFDVFSHLTFGLLEGWWLFEDASLRIPGSPALSPESWRDVLHGEGFPSVVLVLPQARALGQQIIAAESDGIARRPVSGSVADARPAPVPNQPAASDNTPHERPSAESRAETVVAYLREKAAATLKIPAEKIDPSVSLIQYGMDSILVLQLANALREDFEDVSPTVLFDAESVDELSAHFLDTYRDRVDALVLRRGQEA